MIETHNMIRKRESRWTSPILECGLPEDLHESILRMEESWNIIDSGRQDNHWDLCWCDLNALINSYEVEQVISSEQAWYLREKYLRMGKE